MLHLLVIDEDPATTRELRKLFPAPAHRTDSVTSGAEALERLWSDAPDVVVLEARLRNASGLDLFDRIREIDPRIPVIFATAGTSAVTAIEAMKRGAFDYLAKPLDLAILRQAVEKAAEIVRHRAPAHATPDGAADEVHIGALTGNSRPMLEVYKAIGRVAAQNVNVLVTGESGTGKELVARAIHEHSARVRAPFLALNCAAIPEALLEAELFGHEKGAFTGADRRRIGKFEQCSGGTILLDEIGDMPLPLQAKVLRLVQEQTFERVGGTETIKTDVRIIASTHRDLKGRAADEKFRADLYYRLAVFTIELPPLRTREGDLRILVEHYLKRFNAELRREVSAVSREAFTKLESHPWPGNVRELQAVLKKALLQASGGVLLASFLPDLEVPAAVSRGRLDVDGFISSRLRPDAAEVYSDTHDHVDRLLFTRALEYTQGNHRDAARILGISRQTMRTKLRALGIHVTQTVEADDAVD